MLTESFIAYHAMTPLIEDMCDSPNTGRYRAAITADLEGAFDAT